MMAVVTVIQYRMLIRGLEWDETQLVLDKIMMLMRRSSDGDDSFFLDYEVNLEGGAYWPDQHYIMYSRILDEAGSVIIETPGMARLIPPTVFPSPAQTTQALKGKTVHYRQAPNGRAYFLHSAMAWSGGADGPRRVIQVAMDETGERTHDRRVSAGYPADAGAGYVDLWHRRDRHRPPLPASGSGPCPDRGAHHGKRGEHPDRFRCHALAGGTHGARRCVLPHVYRLDSSIPVARNARRMAHELRTRSIP